MGHPVPGQKQKDSELRVILVMLLLTLAIATGVGVIRMKEIAAERLARTEHYDPDQTPSNVWPCERDAQQFCPGMPRGDGQVNICLDDHQDELSAACSDYRELTDPPNVWDNICRGELQSFCSGRSQVITCLREHKSVLTQRCAGLLRRYETSSQWRHACQEDADRLCSNLAADAHTAEPCMRSHQADLSDSCRVYYAMK